MRCILYEVRQVPWRKAASGSWGWFGRGERIWGPETISAVLGNNQLGAYLCPFPRFYRQPAAQACQPLPGGQLTGPFALFGVPMPRPCPPKETRGAPWYFPVKFLAPCKGGTGSNAGHRGAPRCMHMHVPSHWHTGGLWALGPNTWTFIIDCRANHHGLLFRSYGVGPGAAKNRGPEIILLILGNRRPVLFAPTTQFLPSGTRIPTFAWGPGEVHGKLGMYLCLPPSFYRQAAPARQPLAGWGLWGPIGRPICPVWLVVRPLFSFKTRGLHRACPCTWLLGARQPR